MTKISNEELNECVDTIENTVKLLAYGGDPYFIIDEEPPKTCDKSIFFFPGTRCNNKAHMEVYWKDEKGVRHWSYLCKFHYYIDRIKNFIFRDDNWYCDIDD